MLVPLSQQIAREMSKEFLLTCLCNKIFALPEILKVFRFDGFDVGVACLIFGVEGLQIMI